MMTKITCPKCQNEIEITEVMSTQLTAQIRSQLEAELQPRRQQLDKQVADLRKQSEALEEAKKSVEDQVRQKLAAERGKLVEQAKAQAAEAMAVELKDREEQFKEIQSKLKDAQNNELQWRKKERDLKDREDKLRQEQDEIQEQIKRQLAEERQKLVEQAKKSAYDEMFVECNDLREQLATTRDRLQMAIDAELALRKKERELQEKTQQLELDITRQLDAERDKIRDTMRKQFDEEHQLKVLEKEQQINGLRKQIDDLKRKAEQGSQQTQGEVLEIALEDLLREHFSMDMIGEVPKGIRGADIMQRVQSSPGVDCGMILWESKRTKSWSKDWLPKLRQDQRETGATVAILVTTSLPDGIENFDQIDGVWVCNWSCATSVAAALRVGLLEVAKARRALEGQHGKMEEVYHYLTSTQFRNRVEGIIEAFTSMRGDLETEKRAFQKHWARREKQIEMAVKSTAGMYGDFQGIIGVTLPEIESISMPQLEAKD